MIPISIPNLDGAEKKYVDECLRTNFVSSVGPFVSQLEEGVAKISGQKFGVATNSGTSALHLALVSYGVKPGDLVIVPSYTFIASANAVSYCGAQPWLLDISPSSWTLDPQLLTRALENETQMKNGECRHKSSQKRVSAIIPVHVLGIPADLNAISKTAKRFNLPVIADGAAAIGATYMGKPVAASADCTVYSFNGNKTITAGGGGMVVVSDSTMAKRLKHLSTTARIGSNYDHDEIGYNYRLTNLQAAVALGQLSKLQEFVKRKRYFQKYYEAALCSIAGVEPIPFPDYGESSCWMTGVKIQSPKIDSVQVICNKLADRKIESRLFWKPIHLQQVYSGVLKTNMSVSDSVWQRFLVLPSSTQMTDDQLKQVAKGAFEILNEVLS